MRKSKLYQVMGALMALFMIGIVTGAFAQAGRNTPDSASGSADSNKVVLKVGNMQVTQSDVDFLVRTLSPQQQQQLQHEGKRTLGEQYATMLVLSQAAASQHLDSSPVFQKAMEQHRNQLLAELEYQNLLQKAAVTPAEVNQYYTTHQDDFKQAQVREVAIRKKSQGAQGNGTGLAPAEAKAKAEAIRKALASGEDPKLVAKNFAVPNEVIVETEPRTIQNSPSLPAFAKTAFQLKPGEISQVEDTPSMLVFFQVVSHPQVSLKDATPEIENALRQQKVQTEVEGLKKNTPIWMDPSYFGSTNSPASGSDSTGQSPNPSPSQRP